MRDFAEAAGRRRVHFDQVEREWGRSPPGRHRRRAGARATASC
jgi:hypothetical protein